MRAVYSILFLIGFLSLSQAQTEVPYTLEDRDRVIRVEAKMETLEARMEALETKMEALETKMDVKFEMVNSRIDYLFWIIGFLASLMIFMLGYMIWDRRTALKPAIDKTNDANEKSKSLILVLKDYAKKNPEFAEIMRSHGIL